jgi:hypothetical protein
MPKGRVPKIHLPVYAYVFLDRLQLGIFRKSAEPVIATERYASVFFQTSYNN